jgi:hypothetical protein
VFETVFIAPEASIYTIILYFSVDTVVEVILNGNDPV